jgi:hypothetical protein
MEGKKCLPGLCSSNDDVEGANGKIIEDITIFYEFLLQIAYLV